MFSFEQITNIFYIITFGILFYCIWLARRARKDLERKVDQYDRALMELPNYVNHVLYHEVR